MSDQDKSSNDSLEALIDEENKKSAQKGEVLRKKKKSHKRRFWLLVGSISICVLILGGAGFYFIPLVGSSSTIDDETSTTESPAPSGDSNSAYYEQEVQDQTASNVESWQTKFYKEQDSTELSENLTNYAAKYLDSYSSILPSQALGYDNSLDDQYLDDGSLNPLFSYWTQEDFDQEVSLDLNRLLNPYFGGWYIYQHSEYEASKNFNLGALSDMFVSTWESENLGKAYADYVPVYADWNDNDYGLGDQLTLGVRWTGEVENLSIDFAYDDSILGYKATLVANVKFSTYTTSGDTLTKNGKLTLNLIPNPDGTANNRVLIESSSLSVND